MVLMMEIKLSAGKHLSYQEGKKGGDRRKCTSISFCFMENKKLKRLMKYKSFLECCNF